MRAQDRPKLGSSECCQFHGNIEQLKLKQSRPVAPIVSTVSTASEILVRRGGPRVVPQTYFVFLTPGGLIIQMLQCMSSPPYSFALPAVIGVLLAYACGAHVTSSQSVVCPDIPPRAGYYCPLGWAGLVPCPAGASLAASSQLCVSARVFSDTDTPNTLITAGDRVVTFSVLLLCSFSV